MNVDETPAVGAITDKRKKVKVVGALDTEYSVTKVGKKKVAFLTVFHFSRGLTHVTLEVATTASGHGLPVMVIFNVKNLPDEFPDISVWNTRQKAFSGSSEGWINRNIWRAWVHDVFGPWLTKKREDLGRPEARGKLSC